MHLRIKTAHLQSIQAWIKAGHRLETYNNYLNERIKIAASKPKPKLSEELRASFHYHESKRKGWKSSMKDRVI